MAVEVRAAILAPTIHGGNITSWRQAGPGTHVGLEHEEERRPSRSIRSFNLSRGSHVCPVCYNRVDEISVLVAIKKVVMPDIVQQSMFPTRLESRTTSRG